ncbi:ETX/MTX2 family pore-forming toxin, partial [Actinokineospora sp.]|uniref:ETX/MTX2 family pore-forming toxin n=1 Tax=Actinokineospora sp. TaxID=1872133 RepID=UPI003D6ACFC8
MATRLAAKVVIAILVLGTALAVPARSDFMSDMQDKIAAQIRGKATGAPAWTGYGTVPADWSAANVLIMVYSTTADANQLAWTGTQLVAGNPESLDHLLWTNSTSEPQSWSSTLTDTYTDTFEYSTTKALSVGVEVSLSVGLPAGVEAGTTLSTEVSLSSTATTTSTRDKSWSRTVNVNVSPHMSTYASLVVTPSSATATWTAPVVVDGTVYAKGLTYGGVDFGMSFEKQLSQYLPNVADRTFVTSGRFTSRVGT